MTTYTGGCHCGAVRYEVDVAAAEHRALDCNCSICARKGYLHVIVPRERFRLLSSPDTVATYRFGTGVAQHHFCTTCGIHSWYVPRSHPESVDVNLRCLDGDVATHFTVERFDGRNWEHNVATIR